MHLGKSAFKFMVGKNPDSLFTFDIAILGWYEIEERIELMQNTCSIIIEMLARAEEHCKSAGGLTISFERR